MGDGRGHTACGRELFGLNEQTFHLLPVRDVTRNLGSADYAAGSVPDRRNRDRNLKAFAALLHSHRFVVINSVSGSELSEDLIFFVMELFWNKTQNRLSHHLLRGVAEHADCALVPRSNNSVEILTNNGIVGSIDDRRQLKPALIIILKVGNVSRNLRGAKDRTGRIPDWRDRGRYGKLLATFSDSDRFVMIDPFSGFQIR